MLLPLLTLSVVFFHCTKTTGSQADGNDSSASSARVEDPDSLWALSDSIDSERDPDEINTETGRPLRDKDTLSVGGKLPLWTFELEEPEGHSEAKARLTIKRADTGALVQVLDSLDDSGFVLVDINLDGYLDLRSSASNFEANTVSPVFSFALFDSATSRFVDVDDYASIGDYVVSPKRKTLNEYFQSTGGRGGEWATYRIVGPRLEPLAKGSSNGFDCDEYRYTHNGWVTISLSQTEERDDTTTIVRTYRRVRDSLKLVETLWMRPTPEEREESAEEDVTGESVPGAGGYIFRRKAVYDTLTSTYHYFKMNDKKCVPE
jgi:hypothetical protein